MKGATHNANIFTQLFAQLEVKHARLHAYESKPAWHLCRYADALQAWQGMNVEQLFPQGQVFTLPNMTWGQPTFWVIKMVAESYRPRVLAVDASWQGRVGQQVHSRFSVC